MYQALFSLRQYAKEHVIDAVCVLAFVRTRGYIRIVLRQSKPKYWDVGCLSTCLSIRVGPLRASPNFPFSELDLSDSNKIYVTHHSFPRRYIFSFFSITIVKLSSSTPMNQMGLSREACDRCHGE